MNQINPPAGAPVDRWIAFERAKPSNRCTVFAADWQEARRRGCRVLPGVFEVSKVWAVAPLDGETDAEAVARAVKK